jgi:hypothetical protein
MKQVLLLGAFIFFMVNSQAQKYFQQQVNYTINVSLNDVKHSLTGNLTMEYINNSPNTLDFIYIHLWPNAYKNKETALFKQLENIKDRSDKLTSFKGFGSIDNIKFTENNQVLKVETDAKNIDIIKVILNKPLASGQKVTLATPFVVNLPDYFSRLGHNGQYYMITQWYPKPAVYDAQGWHQMPYLDQGEFYSEYGNFKVSITLPGAYIVAGTGELKTKTEIDAYKKAGADNVKKNELALKNKSNLNKIKPTKVITGKGTKTLLYEQNNVHDFAWFACKEFVVQYQNFKQPNGNSVDAFAFHYPEHVGQWYNGSTYCKDAVNFYSKNVGAYQYSTVKAVEGPKNQSSGGMEYPTVTLITSPDADQEGLDGVITHEVGHNWFFSILGSNERDHPYLDEGFNTFYQFRYEAEKYRINSYAGPLPKEVKDLPVDKFQNAIYGFFDAQIPGVKPINTKSEDFETSQDYALVAYAKTATWLFALEQILGKETFDNAMQTYYDTWKNKHPQPDDFKTIILSKANGKADEWFKLLEVGGSMFKSK